MQSALIYSHDQFTNGRNYSIFIVGSFTSSDARYAVSAAMGIRLDRDNDLIELPGIYEMALLNRFSGQIAEYRRTNRRFLFIIDITDFPYIATAFDTVTPTITNIDDRFEKDVVNAWNGPVSNIPVIVVNIHLPHTGLKIIPY